MPVRGVAKTRRLLKRLPDATQGEVLKALGATGKQLAAIMLARAPRRTGKLAGRIDYKVFPTTLKMQVGILGTKKERAQVFYARILEFGRKAQTVTVRHGPHAGSSMQISPIAAQHFILGSDRELRDTLTANLQSLWGNALSKAAEGGGGYE